MRLFTAAITLMLLIPAACAAPDISSLRLQEAIDIALRQNPGLLAARSEVDAARANERGAGTLSNPEIVVTPGLTGDAGSDEELSITQPLEINGRRRIRASIARAETAASQAAYQAAVRDAVRAVKQAYWEIAGVQSIVDLNRANVELADTLHQSARRQLDVGSAPGAQAIKAQVELSRARQELVRSESDLAQAKASLNTLMGRPTDTLFELADKLEHTAVEIDADRLVADADKRPELAEAESVLAARKAEVQAVDARRRPDLELQARQEEFGGDGGLAIGVTLPLLDWGSERQDRKRAEAAADAQARRVEAARNSIALDVDSALREVTRSRALIEEYELGALAQAEQLAEMAQKGYSSGANNYLEVLEAQRTLRAVRTEYYTALADYQKALAQLEWASGADLPVAAAASPRPAEEVAK